MKPFNLEEAKAGKPVVTRDGHKAEIIKWDFNSPSGYSLIVVVTKEDGKSQSVQTCTQDGRYFATNASFSNSDLFMASEKKQGWVNLYKTQKYPAMLSEVVYASLEEAKKGKSWPELYITTAKIEWEE